MLSDLQPSLELRERPQLMALELADPAFIHLLDGDRVEVMQLVTSTPNCRQQIAGLQQQQVLRHRLARHVQMLAEFPESLAIALMQQIQQAPAVRIGERLNTSFTAILICNHTVACQARANCAAAAGALICASPKPPENYRCIH